MGKKILIQKNTMGDTRTAERMPTIDEFDQANEWHKNDVRELMGKMARMLTERAKKHDWTKTTDPYRSMFYAAMASAMSGGPDFMRSEWATLHYSELERHHLSRYIPEDVNLIDVIEMICDIIAAAAARSGKVPPEEIHIPDAVLQSAVSNTVNMLCEAVKLLGWESGEDGKL